MTRINVVPVQELCKTREYLRYDEFLSKDLCSRLFDIDFESGELFWKVRCKKLGDELGMSDRSIKRFNTLYANKPCKSKNNCGYKQVQFCVLGVKINVLQHRLIWFMYYNNWPPLLDHVDGDKMNNSIRNLRVATTVENTYNRKHNSKTNCNGVCWSKSKNKWRAYASYNKRQIHLGYFDGKEGAIVARENWEKESGFLFRQRNARGSRN